MALNPRRKLLKQDAFKKKTTAQRISEAEQKRKGIVPVVDQAPTIDPNAPRLGDDRKKGVFTNSAGQTVNSAGRPVEASGKPIADPTAEEPVRTYEQMGESLAQESYNISDLEKELYGDTKTETSMDKYFQNLISEQDRQSQRAKDSLAYQESENIAQTADANKQIRSGTEAQLAGLTAGGREGVTGGTLGSRLKEVQGTQLARLQASAQESQAQIEDVKAKLAVAEREGRRDLVNAYQQQLDAYTVQAQESEANLVSALSEQAKTQSAITQTNIQTFQGLIDEGQELSVETISGFANQIGIDFDTAYGSYAGVQNIRDDKMLSNEEKEVQIAQAKQNLDDQINGLRTTQAQNIAYLDQLRKMGASPEIISAFKSSAGITDYDDPLTQADLEYKQLENEIKRKQMNGEPVSVSDYETLFDLKQKINASAGTGGTAYVSPSIDGIAMTYEGGQLNVTLPTNPDGTLKAYQCGEFVNRAWGLSAGGANGFGSTAKDKQNLVSKNGFFTEGKSFPELLGLIKPGMAFASYAGSTDHTGLIVSAPDAQGNYMTLEANVGDNNPNVSDPPIYKTRNIKDQDVYGFVYPPNGQPTSAGGGDAQAVALSDAVNSLAFNLTKDQRASFEATAQGYIDSGNYEKATNYLLTSALKSLPADTQQKAIGSKLTMDLISSIQSDIQSLADKGTDLSFLKGKYEDVANKIGKTTDPEIAKLQNKIFSAMQKYRQSMTGAGFAETETAEYNKIFPSIGAEIDLNNARVEGLAETLQASLDAYYGLALGDDVYKSIIGRTDAVVEEENPWGEIDTESPDDILNLW